MLQQDGIALLKYYYHRLIIQKVLICGHWDVSFMKCLQISHYSLVTPRLINSSKYFMFSERLQLKTGLKSQIYQAGIVNFLKWQVCSLFVHISRTFRAFLTQYLGTGISNSRGISEGWSVPQAARDLLLKMVIYDPNARIVPCDAMRDGYFET